jgi:hypothetical protein
MLLRVKVSSLLLRQLQDERQNRDRSPPWAREWFGGNQAGYGVTGLMSQRQDASLTPTAATDHKPSLSPAAAYF